MGFIASKPAKTTASKPQAQQHCIQEEKWLYIAAGIERSTVLDLGLKRGEKAKITNKAEKDCQLFKWEHTREGSKLLCKTGFYLDIHGTDVVGWSHRISNNQIWNLTTGNIVSEVNGLVLEVNSSRLEDGAELILSKRQEGAINQTWTLLSLTGELEGEDGMMEATSNKNAAKITVEDKEITNECTTGEEMPEKPVMRVLPIKHEHTAEELTNDVTVKDDYEKDESIEDKAIDNSPLENKVMNCPESKPSVENGANQTGQEDMAHSQSLDIIQGQKTTKADDENEDLNHVQAQSIGTGQVEPATTEEGNEAKEVATVDKPAVVQVTPVDEETSAAEAASKAADDFMKTVLDEENEVSMLGMT